MCKLDHLPLVLLKHREEGIIVLRVSQTETRHLQILRQYEADYKRGGSRELTVVSLQ